MNPGSITSMYKSSRQGLEKSEGYFVCDFLPPIQALRADAGLVHRYSGPRIGTRLKRHKDFGSRPHFVVKKNLPLAEPLIEAVGIPTSRQVVVK